MSMRTPLKNVRYLGSAKEGTDHFWTQRVTGAANAVLTVFAICLALSLLGADHETVKATLSKPLVAVPLLIFIVSAAIHMRLGMQVIVEDYVHAEPAKILILVANTFFAIAVAAAGAFSILKIAFGG